MYRPPTLSSGHAAALVDYFKEHYDDLVRHLIDVDPDEDAQLTADKITERLVEIATSSRI